MTSMCACVKALSPARHWKIMQEADTIFINGFDLD